MVLSHLPDLHVATVDFRDIRSHSVWNNEVPVEGSRNFDRKVFPYGDSFDICTPLSYKFKAAGVYAPCISFHGVFRHHGMLQAS